KNAESAPQHHKQKTQQIKIKLQLHGRKNLPGIKIVKNFGDPCSSQVSFNGMRRFLLTQYTSGRKNKKQDHTFCFCPRNWIDHISTLQLTSDQNAINIRKQQQWEDNQMLNQNCLTVRHQPGILVVLHLNSQC